jgi:ketosteroid isomerase-like protein
MSGPGSIFQRNKTNSLEAQTQLWRALCDKPKTVKKYLTDDVVWAESDNKIYSRDTEPTVIEHINNYEPWTAYRIHGEPAFVEVDMMSAALLYRVTVWRQQEGGQMIPTEGVCSSVWRQDAGGDWKCCMHQFTKAQET